MKKKIFYKLHSLCVTIEYYIFRFLAILKIKQLKHSKGLLKNFLTI